MSKSRTTTNGNANYSAVPLEEEYGEDADDEEDDDGRGGTDAEQTRKASVGQPCQLGGLASASASASAAASVIDICAVEYDGAGAGDLDHNHDHDQEGDGDGKRRKSDDEKSAKSASMLRMLDPPPGAKLIGPSGFGRANTVDRLVGAGSTPKPPSSWLKRAKNFLPILLLIVYSALGGLLFWVIENAGQAELFAAQEESRVALLTDAVSNLTALLVETLETLHNSHLIERLASFDYTRFDVYFNTEVLLTRNGSETRRRNASDAAERLLRLYNESLFDANNRSWYASPSSSSLERWNNDSLLGGGNGENCTGRAPSDFRFYMELLNEALDDRFRIDDDGQRLFGQLLLNFTVDAAPLISPGEFRQWTFWDSIFYAGTIYTTIGYGYVTASTVAGRAVSMVYALFGIPLVLYTLNQLGRFLCYFIWQCYGLVLNLAGLCLPDHRKKRTSHVAEFPFLLAVAITVIWIMMCSGIFCAWEDWDYFTSFYFFFQSLTTIGFGDVQPQHPEYLVGSFLLIIIGLALVSMCWSLLQMKLDMLLTAVTDKITEKFVHMELEGGRMTTDLSGIETEIEKIATSESGWLATLMNESRRQVLRNQWQQRASMDNKAVQTENPKKDSAVQMVPDSQESSCQTPAFLSPVHRTSEVPYREIRRGTLGPASGQQVDNDEFKALLHGLRNIIDECQVTVTTNPSQYTSSSRSGTTDMLQRSTGGTTTTGASSMSRASTTASVSMMDL